MDPQRNFSGDGDQRWFEGGDWNRGRHGAPADGSGAYHAAEEEYTGEVRAAYGGQATSPAAPPAGSLTPPPSAASESAEAQRRTTEAIDVAAMRRPPVSSPPAAYPPPPAYGGGPEPPLYPADPGAERPLYPPPSQGPERPGYPPPNQGPEPGPLSAPTAAVHTVPPPRQPMHQPSVYQSRKPVVLVALIALTVLFEVPALRLLASATLADNVPANGVVAGTFLVLGIPVFAYGLYGMLGGGPVPEKLSAWLRQPLIYVPLGVLLFLFAALAA